MKMDLTDCPEILQSEVQKYIDEHQGTKVIFVKKYDSTIYKDKTIVNTTYYVGLEYDNLFMVMRYSVCSRPEWTDDKVCKDSMISGVITDIIENSDWFSDYIKKG